MKSKFKIVITLLLILSITGCSKRTCPTNDKGFFYKQAGVKPNKQFMHWNKN